MNKTDNYKKAFFIAIIILASSTLAYYSGKALAAYEKGKSINQVLSTSEISPLILALGVSLLALYNMKEKNIPKTNS